MSAEILPITSTGRRIEYYPDSPLVVTVATLPTVDRDGTVGIGGSGVSFVSHGLKEAIQRQRPAAQIVQLGAGQIHRELIAYAADDGSERVFRDWRQSLAEGDPYIRDKIMDPIIIRRVVGERLPNDRISETIQWAREMGDKARDLGLTAISDPEFLTDRLILELITWNIRKEVKVVMVDAKLLSVILNVSPAELSVPLRELRELDLNIIRLGVDCDPKTACLRMYGRQLEKWNEMSDDYRGVEPTIKSTAEQRKARFKNDVELYRSYTMLTYSRPDVTKSVNFVIDNSRTLQPEKVASSFDRLWRDIGQ